MLLTWQCEEVSGSPKLIDEELDQLATASIVTEEKTTANHSTLERPFRDVDITTIRYENSNGFVPITPESKILTTNGEINFADNYTIDKNFTSEEHLSLYIRNPEYSKDDKFLENDPVYSTEARFFLSLTQPILSRRSSDTHDSSDEFELLKINDQTPTVANYDNFYNSFLGTNQNSRNQAKEVEDDNTRLNHHRDNQNLERQKNYYDNRARSKKIDNYMLNYGDNQAAQSQRNLGTSPQYFSYSNVHDDRSKNGYKESSGARNNYPSTESYDYNSQKEGKTTHNFHTTQQQNYNQHDVPNFQLNLQNVQKVSPSTAVTYRQKHPKQKSPANRPRPSGKQQVPQKPKTVANTESNLGNISPRSQNYNLNTQQEEAPSYFEHEALFNRDEINQNYEKIEEAKELSDENYEYVEITEKPKRYRKQRKRPGDPIESKRLPKEHRDFDDSIDIDETTKPKTRFRPKTRNQKSKGNTWLEQDDDLDEGGYDVTSDSSTRKHRLKNQNQNQNSNQKTKDNTWSSVSPNVEISHSGGIEIDQTGKPKLVVPLKVNLVPLGNFDHHTALGNSQGFDLSNAVLQNFVTSTPVTFNNGGPIPTINPILNTPNSIFAQNVAKSLQNIHNQNVKVPEVIVGQNSYPNPVQTILVPQQSYQSQYKFGQNVRNPYVQNNLNSYAQNQNLQTATYNVVPPNLLSQNVQNSVYNQNQNTISQNLQNPNGNQLQNIQSNSQFNNPHPTPQTFANFPQNGGQSVANYNVQVNPHGLQGQTSPAVQNLYTPQNNVGYSSTPSTNYLQNGNNIEATENSGKRNIISGSNGQFLASASLTVGEQIQNQINAQNFRPQLHENLNQSPKTIQPYFNLNNQNALGSQVLNRDEQISQASNAIAQTYKDQNQQILKVANDIFESTLKQLKQLQKSQNIRANRVGHQNLQNQDNTNSGKPDDSHFQNYGTKNVEIINPGIRPSLVDHSFNNPFANSHNYGGLSFTTPFPIYATTPFDTSARPPILSTIGPLSINGYLDSLTELGAKEQDLKTSPTTNSKPNAQKTEPVMFNPINFVPSPDTLKSQKALNIKYNVHEPLMQGLNLVPLIPGGNFYKNTHFSQDDLIYKPKLSSDLQKYAEEMFKESLRTIYNTQKWNNDHKAQGSEISSISTSPKIKEDQNGKFSLPDIKPSNQILEAHYTETGSKDSGHASRPADGSKRFPPQNSDLADVIKSDFKLSPPISLEPVRFYYKPNIHLNRPSISDTAHPDFKFNPDSTDFIHDFLTPPKPNAFISKSPFNEPFPKRRPGNKRPNGDVGHGKFHGRPESGGPSRHPSGVVEAASSNVAHHSFSFDAPRYEFLQNKLPFENENQDFESDYQNSFAGMRGQNSHSRYPSLTTSSPISDDYQHYDFNHPRMHNLMGLLRKNKRLPPGSSQSYSQKKDVIPLNTDERTPARSLTHNSRSFVEKKSDVDNSGANLNSTQIPGKSQVDVG